MIDILYCFDKNYNKQAGSSISSLASKIDEKINLYIIHENPESFKSIEKKLLPYEQINKIHMYKFEDKGYDFPNLQGSHVSQATYFRLFIENYLPTDIEYLTYIDADVICLNNPIGHIKNTIEQMKLNGFNIAGRVEGTEEISKEYFEHLGFSGKEYFNAGVVVINFENWIKQSMTKSLLKIMEEKYSRITYWDQDVLNSYYLGNFLHLNEYLNFNLDLNQYSEDSFQHIKNNVIFLHYSGNGKPWKYDSVYKKNSTFYQNAYTIFFKQKYHTDIPLKKHEVVNLLKLFKARQIKSGGSDAKFLFMNLLIILKKAINYYLNR